MAHENRPIEHNYQPEEALALFAADFDAHEFNPYSGCVSSISGATEVLGHEDDAVAVDELADPEDLLNKGIISLAEFEIIMNCMANQVVIRRSSVDKQTTKRNDLGNQSKKPRLTARQYAFSGEALPYDDLER